MMKIVTSWDDGSKLDFRLVELLVKYQLPGIFYIPSNCELSTSEIREIFNLGFEIGAHTTTHPQTLYLLEEHEQYSEIKLNKEWLEDIIGVEVSKFCYPRGRYNDTTVEIVKDCGLVEGRGTMVMNTDIPEDPFRTITTIHVLNTREEYKKMKWTDVAKETFDLAKSKNGYFHIWGHSNEIDRNNEWTNLEQVFNYIYRNR